MSACADTCLLDVTPVKSTKGASSQLTKNAPQRTFDKLPRLTDKQTSSSRLRHSQSTLSSQIKTKLYPLFHADISDSFTLYTVFKCVHNESRVPKFLAYNASDT